ncbi:MAG TPA: hypothetical protein VNE71_13035 [Myxococcota bacterium]|nr:hypothetical protein [Myxococcota bacterium]
MASPLPAADPLASVLLDLGARVQRGGLPELPERRCPTGLSGVDRLLGGGFPRGAVSEIAGPPSSGRTSLAFALLARATACGEVVAMVDAGDAFDPPSAAAAGVDLARLLWVRPPDVAAALRSASHLLAARGFAALVLDLAGFERQAALGPRLWPRLRRETTATDTALVVLSDRRVALGFSDLALTLGRSVPHFEGDFFRSLESEVSLVRQRRPSAGGALSERLRWPGSANAA